LGGRFGRRASLTQGPLRGLGDDTAHAPATLTIEVYTSPTRTFASAVTPQGPGDEATWSPTSATLIYGDHDAILVDTFHRS
jgi:hypothetical protein